MADKSGRADLRTRTNKTSASPHPYDKYRGTELWRVIDQGIRDLVTNGDLIEKTDRSHIVGYLCKAVSAQCAK